MHVSISLVLSSTTISYIAFGSAVTNLKLPCYMGLSVLIHSFKTFLSSFVGFFPCKMNRK